MYEVFLYLKVTVIIKRITISLLAITSSTPYLLIISLDVFRSSIVNNDSDVCFINTHTKGNGSDYDMNGTIQEMLVGLLTIFAFHSRMIHSTLEFVHLENVGNSFCIFLGQTIDDDRFIHVSAENWNDITFWSAIINDSWGLPWNLLYCFPLFLTFKIDFQIKIRSIKRRLNGYLSF